VSDDRLAVFNIPGFMSRMTDTVEPNDWAHQGLGHAYYEKSRNIRRTRTGRVCLLIRNRGSGQQVLLDGDKELTKLAFVGRCGSSGG